MHTCQPNNDRQSHIRESESGSLWFVFPQTSEQLSCRCGRRWQQTGLRQL